MGNGSCGNVIAALASFFIPGLGQLLQGRWFLAGLMFILTAVLWLILMGWAIHLWSIIDAAIYDLAVGDFGYIAVGEAFDKAASILGLPTEPPGVFYPNYTSIHRVAAASSGERSVVTINETSHLRNTGLPMGLFQKG